MDILIMTAKCGAFALSVVAAWHAMKSMRGWLVYRDASESLPGTDYLYPEFWQIMSDANARGVRRFRSRTLKWLATWAVLVIVGVLI